MSYLDAMFGDREEPPDPIKDWWKGPGPKPTQDPVTKVWSDGFVDPMDQPFPDPNFVVPPYPYHPTKEKQKTLDDIAKRYGEGGKIHKAAGPSQQIPKPGTSGCLYPKINGKEFGRMGHPKAWAGWEHDISHEGQH